MRKSLLYLFGMLCMLSSFTGCKDDDNNEPVTIVDGVYKGGMDISLSGVPLTKDPLPQKVYITKTSETNIKMELKNFSFSGASVGDIVVDQNLLVKKGSGYTFTGSQEITLAVIGVCQVELSGTIVNDKITMNINVESNVGKVVVNFAGDKMAKDLSSEAAITDFSGDKIISMVISGTNITFIVADGTTAEDIKALTPTITIPAGATVTPESGKAQDFSKPVTYTVISEDGITTIVYTVSLSNKNDKFGFEEWTIKKDPSVGSTEQFEIPAGMWGTTNDGVMSIKYMVASVPGVNIPYPVASYTMDVKEGTKAVSIKTLHTYIEYGGMDMNEMMGGMIPYVTAGSLFQGIFDTDLNDIMNSTKFGVPFNSKKPFAFRGWYKYTPGKVYYSNKNKVLDIQDKCAIYALLYEEEIDSKTNQNIPLNGTTIKDSKRIVMKATLKDGGERAEWTRFDLRFEPVEGRAYDRTKKYYMTFVCTSSFDGDNYNGAPDSHLIIDDFEIVSE